MQKTQLAVFGAGGIGRTHVDRIQRSSNLALAEGLGIRWFADHRALLDAVPLQGAIIATPNALHVPVALDCLQRGVPVLVEKPMTDTPAQAQELVDAQAKTAGRSPPPPQPDQYPRTGNRAVRPTGSPGQRQRDGHLSQTSDQSVHLAV
jgi:predicted dehydrogenase